MLRFLSIIAIGYILFRGLNMVLKMLLGSSERSNPQSFQRGYNNKKRTSGNVDINYDPRVQSKKNRTSFKGGQYVDFEEVD